MAALPASRVQSLLRYDGVAYTARSVCLRTPVDLRRFYGFSSSCALTPTSPDSARAASTDGTVSLPPYELGNGG